MLDLLSFFAKLEKKLPPDSCVEMLLGFFVLFCLFTSLNFPQMEEDKVSKKKEF